MPLQPVPAILVAAYFPEADAVYAICINYLLLHSDDDDKLAFSEAHLQMNGFGCMLGRWTTIPVM